VSRKIDAFDDFFSHRELNQMLHWNEARTGAMRASLLRETFRALILRFTRFHSTLHPPSCEVRYTLRG